MKNKLKAIVGAVKLTLKQRTCKHRYRANINQVIDTQHPIMYECTNCNKIVWGITNT